MTTPEVMRLLQEMYQPPTHAFIPEFRGGTGYSCEQRADAIAMSLWPSAKEGLKIIGFEIKVSRSDWLHEIKQPDKSHFIKRFCDYWYLVVGDLKVIKHVNEMPADWGLMFCEDGKLHTMAPATLLTPQPVDRNFIASLMRRASKNVTPNPTAV